MNYRESDLNIDFNLSWRLRRFDTSRYFKVLSGLGLKGVDFIAIDMEKKLYLIEVKNYKKRVKSPVAPDVSDLLGTNPALQDHFIKKIENSSQLLEVINKYMNRKWWYRLLFKFRLSISTQIGNKSDWSFWLDAFHILTNKPQNVNCILLLELDESYLELDPIVLQNLPKAILAYCKPILNEKFGHVEICNLSEWHAQIVVP